MTKVSDDRLDKEEFSKFSPERWKLTVVCVSPDARHRGYLTDACLREMYSKSVVDQSVTILYDNRDRSSRTIYAPDFKFSGTPNESVENELKLPFGVYVNNDWHTINFDYVYAMAAISDEQGSSLKAVIKRNGIKYAANGTPGFNTGFGEEPKILDELLRSKGQISENTTCALVINIDEHKEYLALLPPTAQRVAMESRVAFPFTQAGRLTDDHGPYGRQFIDINGDKTFRNNEWFMSLARLFADALERKNESLAANKLRDLAKALLELTREQFELTATMRICIAHVGNETGVPDVMRKHADVLFPILVDADRGVGVVQTKIYDAKLVLSMMARRANMEHEKIKNKIKDEKIKNKIKDETRKEIVISYAGFGLLERDENGCLHIEDPALVRDIVFTLMSLHRGADIYIPAADTFERVKNAVECFRAMDLLENGLMICDTGADPNEDDLAAIMMVMNLNRLAEKHLEYKVTWEDVRRRFDERQSHIKTTLILDQTCYEMTLALGKPNMDFRYNSYIRVREDSPERKQMVGSGLLDVFDTRTKNVAVVLQANDIEENRMFDVYKVAKILKYLRASERHMIISICHLRKNWPETFKLIIGVLDEDNVKFGELCCKCLPAIDLNKHIYPNVGLIEKDDVAYPCKLGEKELKKLPSNELIDISYMCAYSSHPHIGMIYRSVAQIKDEDLKNLTEKLNEFNSHTFVPARLSEVVAIFEAMRADKQTNLLGNNRGSYR